MSMWNTWRNSIAVRNVYAYNKMLPLSLREFMRPFLLTFTLIFVIHKHELLNLILLRTTICTPFDICPLCDDVRQQTSYCDVYSKNTQPNHRINNLLFLNTHFLYLKCLFLTILKFSIFSVRYHVNKSRA